jgi:hypothetical protein
MTTHHYELNDRAATIRRLREIVDELTTIAQNFPLPAYEARQDMDIARIETWAVALGANKDQEDTEAIELAPLCDQPSFPHTADFAQQVIRQYTGMDSIGYYELAYQIDYHVSAELARAAIHHIMTKENK